MGPQASLPCLLCLLALFPQAAFGENGRTYLNWPEGVDPDALIELPILSPVPLTGGWDAGPTMRIAAEIAMDIVNSQQRILPGYRITTAWFDDECDPDVALQVLIEKTREDRPWVGLGGNGCSGVCGRVATITPQLRIPYVSYGCGAGFLSNTRTYPHLQRMMTVENDMALVFHSMGRQFGWTRIVVISGDPLRFEKLAEYIEAYFGETDIACDWLTPRNPTWEQTKELMVRVKRSSQRAIVVLGYQPFFRKVICASFLAGMPHGVVWMSGSHSEGWWLADDPALLTLEPRCNGQLITSYAEGGIESSALGTPEEERMDVELECMPGYTPRSFRHMLAHAFTEGYPVGENILPHPPFTGIQANAADGICLWAYLFREMLSSRGVPLEDMRQPSRAMYLEMVDFIRHNISFAGASGHVQFTGNNIKGVLAVRQVHDAQSTMVATVGSDGQLTMMKTMRWGDGDTAPGSEFEACPDGTIRNHAGGCEACGLGFQFNANHRECVPCSPGSYGIQTSSGDVGCTQCSQGTFSDAPGMTFCHNCSRGFYAQLMGSTACLECNPGDQAPHEGTSQCELCPYGTWSNQTGTVECNPCPIRQTTDSPGARVASSCTCAAGTFFRGQALGCAPCREGLVCDQGGLGEPLQDVGYYIRSDGDFEYMVFNCRSDLRCPRGLAVGTCPTGRTGVACDICMKGMSPSDGGTCAECTATATPLQMFLLILGGSVLLCLFLAYSIYETRISSGSNLTVICCVSIALTSTQILSAMSQMPVDWIEPVITFKRLLSVVSFRLDVMQPECVFHMHTALGHYIGSLMVFPIMAVIVRLMFVLIRLSKRVQVKSPCVWNALGRVFLLGYLPLALLTFAPYQCVWNPGSTPPTLATYRSVVCWDSGEHQAMLAGSVFAVLAFPVSLLVVVILAVLQFPARMAQPGGVVWLKKYTFLFLRFRSEHYYYALVHLLRSLFMALLPNMLPNEPETLVTLMVGILSVSLALQCSLWAWRTNLANVIDVVCSCGLLQIAAAGGTLIKLSGRSNLALEMAITVILIVLAVSTGAVMAYFTCQIICPSKPYAMFLSHHKAGAAVLCRYLKLVMKDKIHGRIFLDCDELDSLDMVFSIAADHSKNFVMVLTQNTLHRFWCAGEIASAYRHKTHMIGLACDDYEGPTDEFIETVASVWSNRQRCELSAMGVSIQEVQAAYRALRTMEMIKFKRDSTLDEQDKVIELMLSKCVGLKYRTATRLGSVATKVEGHAPIRTSRIVDLSQPDLFITGDFADMEAMFTVRVLHRLLQFETLRVIVIVQNGEELRERRGGTINFKQYLLLVCTKGTLECETVPWLLDAAAGMVPTPIVVDESFKFPDATYYKRLLFGSSVIAKSTFAKEYGVKRVAELYAGCFKTLSMRFTSNGSEMIQATEIKAMCHRLAPEQLKEPLQLPLVSPEPTHRGAEEPLRLCALGSEESAAPVDPTPSGTASTPSAGERQAAVDVS